MYKTIARKTASTLSVSGRVIVRGPMASSSSSSSSSSSLRCVPRGVRFYGVENPFKDQKPSSQGHSTSKSAFDKTLNVQSDAVGRGQAERHESEGEDAAADGGVKREGRKQAPEEKTRAPGPVIGMQDERGGKNE